MSQVFSKAPPQINMPPPTPTPAMPDPQSPENQAAKLAEQQRIMGRAGRRQTILTGDQTNARTGGFANYSDARLGASNN